MAGWICLTTAAIVSCFSIILFLLPRKRRRRRRRRRRVSRDDVLRHDEQEVEEEFDFDDVKTKHWSEVLEEIDLRERCVQTRYLVVFSADELFLVIRHINPRMGSDVERNMIGAVIGGSRSCPYKTVDVDVYKIVGKDGGKRRFMNGHLDGLVMFIGSNHSFAMSPASDWDWDWDWDGDWFPPPNSICFTDNKFNRFTPTYGGHDNDIFNCGDY